MSDPRVLKALRDLQRKAKTERAARARCTVRRTSSYSVANSSTTVVLPWTEAVDDPEGMWNSGNPNRITVPSDGWYLCICNVQFAANSSGMRRLQVRRNGSDTDLVGSATQGSNSTTTVDLILNPPLIELVEGDYLEIKPWQTSGGALNIAYGTNFSPKWSVICVG